MKDLSLNARIYIYGSILVAIILFSWNMANIGVENLWETLLLAAIASLALIIKVEGTTNRSHYNFSFLPTVLPSSCWAHQRPCW